MGITTLLGAIYDAWTKAGANENFKFLNPIMNLLDIALIPILIIVLAVGTIYSVILGVNMARADSTEKRDEAKKRLINAIVGFGVIIVLIVIIFFVATNLTDIINGINKGAGGSGSVITG